MYERYTYFGAVAYTLTGIGVSRNNRYTCIALMKTRYSWFDAVACTYADWHDLSHCDRLTATTRWLMLST